MSKTAFVTGGTGFVGANLVRHLAQNGWDVTALHRASSNTDVLQRFSARLVCGDVLDYDAVRSAIPDRVDAVFHVASDLNFDTANNDRQTRINVDGTRHMVDAAIARGAGSFVYTSTLATYGVHDAVVDEDTPQTAGDSTLNYARTKWRAEQVVRDASSRGLRTAIINSGGIFGPYDRTTWGTFFFLVRDGLLPYAPDAGVMTWSYVDDVVAAHEAAATSGRSGANYILGGAEADLYTVLGMMADLLGVPLTTRRMPADLLMRYAQVQAEIAGLYGEPAIYTPEIIDVFAATYRCDDARARRDLAYRSRPLRDMLVECHAWLVSEGLL